MRMTMQQSIAIGRKHEEMGDQWSASIEEIHGPVERDVIWTPVSVTFYKRQDGSSFFVRGVVKLDGSSYWSHDLGIGDRSLTQFESEAIDQLDHWPKAVH